MVMQKYPSADQSMPARYARAIAMFRRGDIKNALPIIDGLIKDLPENPYFWKLKAQALLENGRAAEAVAPGREGTRAAAQQWPDPNPRGAGLFDTEKPANAKGGDQAAAPSRSAPRVTPLKPIACWRVPMPRWATCRAPNWPPPRPPCSWRPQARHGEGTARPRPRFKTGTPEWTQASDVMSFAGRD